MEINDDRQATGDAAGGRGRKAHAKGRTLIGSQGKGQLEPANAKFRAFHGHFKNSHTASPGISNTHDLRHAAPHGDTAEADAI